MSQDLMSPHTELIELGAVCAVIPARGGSKGVPRKNLRLVGGESLIVRAIRTVSAVSTIGVVYVSTDDAEIAAAASAAGARIVERPADMAGDTASSEAALRHALEQLASVPEITVFVQATSPFIDGEALEAAIELVRDDVCDVAFSVTRSDVHLWRQGADGPEGINHDSRRRQRRQDRAPEYAETGAFYVMRTSGLLQHGHRFFGRLQMIEVEPVGALEIDTEHDLRLAELVAASHDGSIGAYARTEARVASRIVLRRNGGEGAVRERADRVLDSIAPTKGHDHG